MLSTRHPDKGPQLLAYLRTIVRASRNFEGPMWASYDACYHRQEANQRSLDWAKVDSSLYSQAFTGRARIVPRCRYCLDNAHHSRDRVYAPPTTSENVQRPPRPVSRNGHAGQDSPRGTAVEVCRLFNKPRGPKPVPVVQVCACLR